LDILTIALCLSIGNAVAWLLALYTEGGIRPLLWNIWLGTAGAFMCVLAVAWTAPGHKIVVLMIVGPLCALLAIIIGQAAIRAVGRLRRR
jgi:hypothetical protein